MGLVLVGRDNPYGSDPEWALYDQPAGCSGHRLRRFMGLPSEVYRGLTRLNLCEGAFSLPAGRLRAVLVRREYPEATLLLFGRDVQAAFGLGPARSPTFQILQDPQDPGRKLLSLPHPSGLCREWTPAAVATFRRILTRIAPDLPIGTSQDTLYP